MLTADSKISGDALDRNPVSIWGVEPDECTVQALFPRISKFG